MKVMRFRKTGEYLDTYDSLLLAAIEFNLRSSDIKLVCEGKRKTVKGFVFKYEKSIVPEIDSLELKRLIKESVKRSNAKSKKINKKDIPIKQFYLDGEYIREWKNAAEASKKLGIQQSGISRACRGFQQTCGKFIWRYKK